LLWGGAHRQTPWSFGQGKGESACLGSQGDFAELKLIRPTASDLFLAIHHVQGIFNRWVLEVKFYTGNPTMHICVVTQQEIKTMHFFSSISNFFIKAFTGCSSQLLHVCLLISGGGILQKLRIEGMTANANATLLTH